jgi:hypothetical protein
VASLGITTLNWATPETRSGACPAYTTCAPELPTPTITGKVSGGKLLW